MRTTKTRTPSRGKTKTTEAKPARGARNGPMGWVAGLRTELATDVLVQTAQHILEQGGEFTMQAARERIRETHDLGPAATLRLAEELRDLSLATRGKIGEGHYRLPAGAVRFLRHRPWRAPAGRLRLVDAEQLVTLLRAHQAELQPGLQRMLEVLESAAAPLT